MQAFCCPPYGTLTNWLEYCGRCCTAQRAVQWFLLTYMAQQNVPASQCISGRELLQQPACMDPTSPSGTFQPLVPIRHHVKGIKHERERAGCGLSV